MAPAIASSLASSGFSMRPFLKLETYEGLESVPGEHFR